MNAGIMHFYWRHPIRTLVYLSILSMLFHAATLYWLHGMADRRVTLGKPEGMSPTVKIKLVEPVKVAPVPSTTYQGKPASTGARKAARPAAAPATTSPAAPRTYSDLLPTGAWQAEQMDKDAAPVAGVNVGVAPAARAAIDEFSSRLDIPLFSRTKGGKSRAVAKILLQPDKTFMLDYLDGDPLLRACLYAALIKPANLEVLRRMMAVEAKTEFVISFTHEESSAVNLSRYLDDFRLADGRLSISRTTYQPMPTSGMPLPDEDARRAIARDKASLDRLKELPAYQSPLRHRLLTGTK